MADHTHIEWTDATWNPITGCSIVSPGCTNCYAMKLAGTRLKHIPSRQGLTRDTKAGPVWTGEVRFNREWLDQPLKWKRPRKIFVCAHGDLFAEGVPDPWIDQVFAVMALAPQHIFQVLTKRPGRMREYLRGPGAVRRIYELACDLAIDLEPGVVVIAPGVDDALAPAGPRVYLDRWPLPNVWLGTSVEDQRRAEERIPQLLKTPAAIRFISAEPLLEPLDIRQWMSDWGCGCGYGGSDTLDRCPSCGWVGDAPMIQYEGGDAPGDCPDCGEPLSDYYACPECKGTGEDGSGFGPNSAWLNWVILGGESGPGARPMHPDWARSLRDQCTAAGVPFFFKQWGAWFPTRASDPKPIGAPKSHDWNGGVSAWLVGKKPAGRLLDGIEHNGMPHHA